MECTAYAGVARQVCATPLHLRLAKLKDGIEKVVVHENLEDWIASRFKHFTDFDEYSKLWCMRSSEIRTGKAIVHSPV